MGIYQSSGRTRNPLGAVSVFVGIVNPSPPPDSGEKQYIVAILVEEGGNGGSVAAPIAKRIMLALAGDPNPPEVHLIPPKAPHAE